MKALLKLIQLEIRKNKLLGMLKGVAITNLAILAFMILVTYIDTSESGGEFKTYADMFEGVYVFTKAAFIIFASVVLSKLVIEEYKNNTITLLFMYPISRKKLMAAKIIIVFLFTVVSIFVSDILLNAVLVGINSFTHVIPGSFDLNIIPSELIRISTDAVYAAGIGLIPLFIGMRKKSVPATIVTAVLVVSLISSGFGNFRMGNQVGVSLALALVGAGIAYLSIRNIEQKDIA
ncbi:ABC transporter permease [Paenibacillus sp. P46E]|uniref:ABC transporter permease n=1 Tax=Paenibacillus sp. P46E TaxID=1349436 RepID=UPI002116EAFF|nr:ABC transporter permease [Paenibacillus sp. P46E]